MNNDQLFLQNLVDFRDLRSASHHQEQRHYTSKASSISSNQQYSPEIQLQLQNNDKLIKNFKELRQQLKQSNKLNQKIKTKLLQRENEIERYKQSEKDHVSNIYQIKHELQQIKNQNEDYKSKFQHYQEIIQGSKQQKDQLDYLKMLTYELKSKLEKSETENRKIMEISVAEKVQLEEKIKKFEAKKNSDIDYIQEMEIQTEKFRQKIIKLQNELKKAEIRYDEQLYNKKWLNGNFQREHLQQQLDQLQKQNSQAQAKLKKQKQRRNNIEKRVLELEELTGLWTVKAQTYEIENKNYSKKFKKLQKKMAQTKQNADFQIQEALNWQEKFLKSVSISEELICRVKRDMYGDVVSLAKSCEFKLNKLKEDKQGKQGKSSQIRRSPSISKLRSKSRTYAKQYQESVSPLRKTNKQQQNRNYTQPQYQNGSDLKAETLCRPLFHPQDYAYTFPNLCGQNSQNNSGMNGQTSYKQDDQTSQSSGNKENNNNAFAQIQNIETKIRKQRQEMQKRIRQKLLYRKIQVTVNSPQKQKLREDYFRLIDR